MEKEKKSLLSGYLSVLVIIILVAVAIYLMANANDNFTPMIHARAAERQIEKNTEETQLNNFDHFLKAYFFTFLSVQSAA